MKAEPVVRAAIFDIGATLVTGPPVAPNKVIASLLNGVTSAEVSSVIMTTPLTSAQSVCDTLQARFGKISPNAISSIQELWNAQCSAARELDGATDTVLALKERGLLIGLLSDIWNPYYESVTKCLPRVIDAADAIVLSCNSGARKPAPDNFREVISRLAVKPEEAVMIGDTYTHDIRPALDMGMGAVWVLARPEREIESITGILNGELPAPTVTVKSIDEVARLDIWQRAASLR